MKAIDSDAVYTFFKWPEDKCGTKVISPHGVVDPLLTHTIHETGIYTYI